MVKKMTFTDEEASKIIEAILSAVCYMHKTGVIHRDLKPGFTF